MIQRLARSLCLNSLHDSRPVIWGISLKTSLAKEPLWILESSRTGCLVDPRGTCCCTVAYFVNANTRTSIGYVEFRTIELVDKALALRGTVVMGLPIMVQLTESERNKLHAGDGYAISRLSIT